MIAFGRVRVLSPLLMTPNFMSIVCDGVTAGVIPILGAGAAGGTVTNEINVLFLICDKAMMQTSRVSGC